MTTRKARLTVTVDKALLEAANDSVAAGRASSLSGWVNLALAERAAKERRLLALAEAIASYERQFGAISAAELVAQEQRDRRDAIVVRDRPGKRQRRRAA
ncbi:MAG: hypothetical protein HY815_28025 [Candidatus Riflebacteria bacterium]|nr:hypothetical protein [Candidatus Riflebacteria bacterium]